MWVPVAVWQPCELLYTCYLLTYLLYVMRPTVTFRVSEHYNALAFIKIRRDLVSTHFIGFCILYHKLNTYRKKWNIRTIRLQYKKVKVAHTRLPRVEFRSWSRFLAVSLQVMWVINPAVGCHYFPPSLQLPLQPLRGLPPISLLGEQRHDGCEQFA